MSVIPCDFQGEPRPSITWLGPDGADVTLKGSVSVDFESGDLTFFVAAPSDEGVYTCRGVNSLGIGAQTTQVLIRGKSLHYCYSYP